MRLSNSLQKAWSTESTSALHDAALQLATLWGDPVAIERARRIAMDGKQPAVRRGALLTTLAATGDSRRIPELAALLEDPQLEASLQTAVLNGLGRFDAHAVATAILQSFSRLPATAQAQAITLLTQRPAWSRQLIQAVQTGQVPASAVGANHLRTLLASRDPELVELVQKQWGTVRSERNPQREQVLRVMREQLAVAAGDSIRGQAIFHKVCGQCHKIHGTGQEVGPDITSNGRASYDQLLSNVFDPSLVIGPAYQAVTVITADGRVLTGLLAEDSEQRIVLKTQGGKIEAIPRGDVEEVAQSKLSLMPENLEQQLQPHEIADLFAFLTLDKPPQDPEAKRISGSPEFSGAK
jgi:putative heme-binding domain-containing protein